MRVARRLLDASLRANGTHHVTLGFVGLGAMGRHMAANLYRKTLIAHSEEQPKLMVCDANTSGVETFKRDFETRYGGLVQAASSPEEVARSADVIFTVLPSSPEVKSVYLGSQGILSGFSEKKKRLCVDCTTLDVDVARDVAKTIRAAGAEMVDSPMSGGIVGAEAGTLSFMVGGEPKAFLQAEPYLLKMGGRVIHCGPSGMGLAAKICNNLILGINQIAIAEGMLLGTSLGLDPALLTFVINNSTGRSWPSEVNNPVPGSLKPPASPPCERDYEGGFASKLMLKDLNLAMHAGEQTGVPLPLGSAATAEFGQVVNEPEFARKDFSVVYQYLRRKLSSPTSRSPA